MDAYGGSRRPSRVPQQVSDGPQGSRIASFSEFAQYESYDPYQPQSPQSPDHGKALPPPPGLAQQYSQPNRPLRGSESMVSMFQPSQHPLRGSESMVSMMSEYNSPSSDPPEQVRPPISRSDTSVSGWSLLYNSGSSGTSTPGHQATPPATRDRPTNQRSRTFSRIALSSTAPPAPIREEPEDYRESIDLANLPLTAHAAPIGHSAGAQPPSSAYAPVAKDDPEDSRVPFDLSGYMGPTSGQDEAFYKAMQEEEASGKLTGGLGVGFHSGETIRGSQLLATSPVVERKPSILQRAFSRRTPAVQRQNTLRALGQSEADKRGEIVEVIIEESDDHEVLPAMSPSTYDVSNALGPNPGFGNAARKNTIPLKEGIARQKTEVFYPQPDWKPFSMRWPYLLSLIILSIVLGGIQEVVFQMSERQEHRALWTFKTPQDIPPFYYFVFKFVPTIVTVGFGVLWSITDSDVKRLEAFYQMSKEGGAPAAESINVDYVTNFNFLNPFRAIYCRHYAVALSTVTSLLAVSLVPTLGAASIVIQPDRQTRMNNPRGEKYITIDPVWSRFLTVVLFFIAFLGCILFWQLQRRRSGLLADVRGIAGLASMAVVSHILMDFKEMDVATHQDIHHKLKHHRYVLRNSSLAPDDDHNTNVASKPRSAPRSERHPLAVHLSSNPHPLPLRLAGGLPFTILIAIFACFLPIVLFTPASALTDRAAWVLTALAVSIKLAWGALDTSVRMMEPYYILARRHAPPKTLTLDYTALPFGWVAVRAALNRHLLVAAVCVGTVMTELLTIVVTSLATVDGRDFIAMLQRRTLHARARKGSDIDAGQETEASFWLILGLALFILFYMASVSVVVLFRRRRPFLPRQPNTIASVLAFIHQSKMLYGFVGTAKLDAEEMLKALEEKKGRTFGLGWFEGRDGQTHCGVDEEELLQGYEVGKDYSRSNKPWVEEHTPWL